MVKWNIEISLKDIYAGLALVIAIILSFIGTYLPPAGQIHDSMLYLIAQFLLLVATLMGVGYFYNKWSRKTDVLGKRIGEKMMADYGGRGCEVSYEGAGDERLEMRDERREWMETGQGRHSRAVTNGTEEEDADD